MSSNGRVFPTLREAIFSTATGAGKPLKALAAELDWSPSELSMRIALAGESARVFPADDTHLVRLMQVTGDHSIVYTLADLLGYELRPKPERTAEMVAELQVELHRTAQRIEQLSLDLRSGQGRKR